MSSLYLGLLYLSVHGSLDSPYCWSLHSGVSRGFSGCPETPPPTMIFFKSGGGNITGTDPHQPLTFATFGNPLETNSGYATAAPQVYPYSVFLPIFNPRSSMAPLCSSSFLYTCSLLLLHSTMSSANSMHQGAIQNNIILFWKHLLQMLLLFSKTCLE